MTHPDTFSLDNMAIVVSCIEYADEAERLAQRLGLAVIDESQKNSFMSVLCFDSQGLGVQLTERKAPKPTRADFISGASAHRRKYGGGAGQMIAKAVGIKPGIRPHVLDATAGLGQDAFVLATLGCELTCVERSPVVHALLDFGIRQAQQHIDVADIAQRMSLHHADSLRWLQEQKADSYPVVYLDPMFPHGEKSAAVKKDMKLFRDLVGADADAHGLLAAALKVAENRVVVKRPRKAPLIDEHEPSYQLEGKSCRYDIYALKKLS